MGRYGMPVALALLTVAAGLPFGTEQGRYALTDLKRDARVALGLPKRWVADAQADTSGAVRARCPGPEALVIVTGGQSNAANELSNPLAVDAGAQTFMAWNGECYRLRDPVLGASGTGGSLWTALGSALWRETGRPVVFVNGAVGGSQLGDWLDERSGYAARLSDQIARARRAGLTPDHVFWVQGETDAFNLTDPDTYVAQMRALAQRLDAVGRTPWLVYRSTRCLKRRGNGPAIDAALAAWTAGSSRFTLGPNGSALEDRHRHDGCHFNALGRRALVAETIAILRPRLGAAVRDVPNQG